MSTAEPDPTARPQAIERSAGGVAQWSAFFDRQLLRAATAGPGLMLIAALCVTANIQRLPGDLDWISQPEGMVGVFAAPLLFATWIVVGRAIAREAPRAGIAVTLIGTVAAAGWGLPYAMRLLLSNLVLNDFDPDRVNAAIEGESTVYAALGFLITTAMMFVVAITAGISVLRTRVAPVWAGAAMILFVPIFIAAQAAYFALPVTYPVATACLLVGVIGVVRSEASAR